MLMGMTTRNLVRTGLALAALCAALPALADSQIHIRRMTRNDVPPGKGQCDIRLQVDGDAEVSVRGDMLLIHNIAGREPRDDGSECNAPLPDRIPPGFNYQAVERRDQMIQLPPSDRRDGFAATVRIHDGPSGEGRYCFRLTWQIAAERMVPPERPEPVMPPEERRGDRASLGIMRFVSPAPAAEPRSCRPMAPSGSRISTWTSRATGGLWSGSAPDSTAR